MAISTNAAIIEYGDPVTVLSTMATIENGSFSTVGMTPLTLVDNVPFVDLVLDITFTIIPATNAAVHVYRRDLNIDGANSAPIPDNQFKQIYVGSFVPDLVTTRQFLSLPSVPVSRDQEFYIENASGSETFGATVLKAIPKTFNGKS
jgi:hypothetical protein